MAFTVPPWLKDKKALAGIGAAAALGAFVLLKRGGGSIGGGGTASASDSATVPTSSSGTPGTYDSTSADIANQLGQYQTGLQTALGQYGADQQAALAAYQKQLTTGLSGLTSGTRQTGTTKTVQPVIVKSWKSSTRYTLDSVARRFGTTPAAIQAANPGRNVKSGIAKGATINIPITKSNASQFGKG